MKGLKLMAHIGGMKELHHHSLARADGAGVGLRDGSELGFRMMHEKSLLRLDDRLPESGLHEAVFQPVPADVAGEILFARPGVDIAAHSLAMVGPNGTRRHFAGELRPAPAVVEGEKEPAPLLS